MLLIKYYGRISEYKLVKTIRVCVWGIYKILSSTQGSPERNKC